MYFQHGISQCPSVLLISSDFTSSSSFLQLYIQHIDSFTKNSIKYAPDRQFDYHHFYAIRYRPDTAEKNNDIAERDALHLWWISLTVLNPRFQR